jgi:hypothetical protein
MYLGSCMVFRKLFCDIFLPIPGEALGYDQWVGLIAERYGGVALVKKPLIQKSLAPGDNTVLTNAGLKQRADEQRKLLKVVKKREKDPDSILSHLK